MTKVGREILDYLTEEDGGQILAACSVLDAARDAARMARDELKILVSRHDDLCQQRHVCQAGWGAPEATPEQRDAVHARFAELTDQIEATRSAIADAQETIRSLQKPEVDSATTIRRLSRLAGERAAAEKAIADTPPAS